ncbi:hypothetical protein BTM25_11410 [Actinomadura rubteroloni]|uniref:Uncharacterized protein n=1 Tax=Actinomadura rubteroloni TaxID=1926885 RepID=A0A2P4UNV8_9ACTN|nr:hypothetical protein [Actinomadura rubteroloni]POM26735.1 hypothetical protein BTM25_11410 [Actinomadura rubteroloni]
MARLGTLQRTAFAVAVLLCGAFTLILASVPHHESVGVRTVAASAATIEKAAERVSCCEREQHPHEAPRHPGARVPALLPDLRLPRAHVSPALGPGLGALGRAPDVPRRRHDHLHAVSRSATASIPALLQVFRN